MAMDANDSYRPPAPEGFEAPSRGIQAPPAGTASGGHAYQQAGATHATPSPSQVPPVTPPPAPPAAGGGRPDKGRGGGRRALTVVLSLLAAVVGAALMFGGLKLSGLLEPVVVDDTESAAGQTIEINATNEDATISQAVAKKCLPSVVSIYVETAEGYGVGSGVILDDDGNILTNYHVVEGAQSIQVTIDESNYVGEVVGSDWSSDLAVVKADLGGDSVTPIEVGDSDALVVGDWVMAIGSPYGLDQSVSTGIVSSLYRSTMLPGASGNTIYTNLIQTDAAINPGNSGGALVNDEGELVGINSIIQSESGSSAGIGFAIPGNYAVEVAEEIIAGDPVLHAYIGLSLQSVTPQNADRAGLSVSQGAYVAEVTAGGPADEAGIKEGDVVVKLDDEDIVSADGLILAVRSHEPGDTVEVTVVRGDEELTFEVELGTDEALQEEERRDESDRFSFGDFEANPGSYEGDAVDGSDAGAARMSATIQELNPDSVVSV